MTWLLPSQQLLCPRGAPLKRNRVNRQSLVLHYLRLTCRRIYQAERYLAIGNQSIFFEILDFLLSASRLPQSFALGSGLGHGSCQTFRNSQACLPTVRRLLRSTQLFLLLVLLSPYFSLYFLVRYLAIDYCEKAASHAVKRIPRLNPRENLLLVFQPRPLNA